MTTDYDLLVEPWIPVLRQSGKKDWIRVDQILETEDPPLRVDSPRPEFDAAITLFLLHIVQTVMAPVDEPDWEDLFYDSPEPQDLQDLLEPLTGVFNLLGDGYRCYQNKEVASEKPLSPEYLLMGSPGVSTVKLNTAFFQKPYEGEFHVSPPTAAALLLCCNLFMGMPGRGYRSPLLAGNILVLFQGPTLWETVWANVVPQENWPGGYENPSTGQRLFTWMGSLPERKDEPRTLGNSHPLSSLWVSIAPIWLHAEGPGTCALSGTEHDVLISGISKTGSHYTYDRLDWEYPWMPSDIRKSKKTNEDTRYHIKSAEALGYRGWDKVAMTGGSYKSNMHSTMRLLDSRLNTAQKEAWMLWYFGVSSDRAKFLQWISEHHPAYIFDVPKRTTLEWCSRHLVAISTKMEALLTVSLQAPPGEKNEKKQRERTLTPASHAQRHFWAVSEERFFDYIGQFAQALQEEPPFQPSTHPISGKWLQEMSALVLDIFHLKADPYKRDPLKVKRYYKNLRALENKLSPESLLELHHQVTEELSTTPPNTQETEDE